MVFKKLIENRAIHSLSLEQSEQIKDEWRFVTLSPISARYSDFVRRMRKIDAISLNILSSICKIFKQQPAASQPVKSDKALDGNKSY